MLGPRRAAPENASRLECGLASSDVERGWLGISFYLIAMFFILFDIEVIFLYPIAVELRSFGSYALVETIMLIALLFVAFVYVWRSGGVGLEVDTRAAAADHGRPR